LIENKLISVIILKDGNQMFPELELSSFDW